MEWTRGDGEMEYKYEEKDDVIISIETAIMTGLMGYGVNGVNCSLKVGGSLFVQITVNPFEDFDFNSISRFFDIIGFKFSYIEKKDGLLLISYIHFVDFS